jgi:hypothetical protein
MQVPCKCDRAQNVPQSKIEKGPKYLSPRRVATTLHRAACKAALRPWAEARCASNVTPFAAAAVLVKELPRPALDPTHTRS